MFASEIGARPSVAPPGADLGCERLIKFGQDAGS
jgi:hypothetical protein